jgi:hypothetical protein
MRSLLASGILSLTSLPAFGQETTILALPEPGSMFLIGLAGGFVLLAIRNSKKK